MLTLYLYPLGAGVFVVKIGVSPLGRHVAVASQFKASRLKTISRVKSCGCYSVSLSLAPDTAEINCSSKSQLLALLMPLTD
jgi:hypothetical protein